MDEISGVRVNKLARISVEVPFTKILSPVMVLRFQHRLLYR